MPRTILATITAGDYANLQQTYSEKNIINQTNGSEYIISTATRSNLTDIHGASMSKPAKTVTISTRCDGKDFGKFKYDYFFGSTEFYLRNEAIVTEGTLSIETDQIITNPNTISASWDIKYDHYYDDNYLLTSNDASSAYPIYKDIEIAANKQNTNGYLSATRILPENAAYYEDTSLIGGGKNYVGGMGLAGWEGVNVPRVTKLANNNYKIDIDYRFATWWGYNVVKMRLAGGIYERTATLYVARQIDFTVSANVVEANEIEFGYKSALPLVGGAKGKNYEIASNEFLQTDENTNPSQRQSAIVSSEIFSKFDNDRMIVSFTLLNCEKYEVNNEKRYLQAEDLIYIKDENGQYLGEDTDANGEIEPSIFEIVKTRPIWNGSFEMEVTCRQIDMTT